MAEKLKLINNESHDIQISHAAFNAALNCPSCTDLNAQLTLSDMKYPGIKMRLLVGDLNGFLEIQYKGKKVLCPPGNLRTVSCA